VPLPADGLGLRYHLSALSSIGFEFNDKLALLCNLMLPTGDLLLGFC